ncbi:bifunctional diguanylate cyclase/phosphodiesterase [Oricola sp.]|uniref:putative bifunctional diguanylate cyclase/phosphodiesterase n=1 Tax=Oricola sp. TaxID=1979950 RepID=UPI0025E2624F|nr:bifunctional diguanylate cyclase/phosphodiesterase [Oricola sp.]MCI5078012.1 bifunctional diguanylate cyclase/phosphodiesterase [Oricola sp.]
MTRRRSVVSRSWLFRLITIVTSGFGAASLALWAAMMSRLGDISSPETGTLTAVVAALAALAGAGCAHAYFAGTDEASKVYEAAIATDPTTGLLSRLGLEKQIGSLVDHAPTGKNRKLSRWMLVSIEIDAFREINDRHGAETGDLVLHLVGGRIRRLVGDLGPAARIAGSEFAFAFEAGHDDHELHAIMSAVLEDMARPIKIDNTVIPVFCTAGLAELGHNGRSISTVLRRTNLARTTARASGLGNWAIYHPEMTQTDTYRKWIEGELSTSIGTDDFELVYQPQVDNRSGMTVGYEALLRWNHPEKGNIPPTEFIPVAENCGLINQLGLWTLDRACADARHLPPGTKIAVNVSPKQLDAPGFVRKLATIMRKHNMLPERLELEITENILILDHVKVRKKFDRITDLGCSISIDDFGTGYSNLGYLAELPFGKLKLDRSLITRLGERENGATLVTTIVNMAHALGAEVLAEGVETKEQVALLDAAGCTLMQGYYFGKPVRPEEHVASMAEEREEVAA